MLEKEFIIIATVIFIFAYLYAVENENTVADKALVFECQIRSMKFSWFNATFTFTIFFFFYFFNFC